MTKFRVIVPLSFMFIAGCALSDISEVNDDKESVPAVVESLPPVPSKSVVTISPEPAPTVVKDLTVDDVWRIQTRLRDVGLDPGPLDGVAGARTKSAFGRFRAGCEQVQSLIKAGKNAFTGATPTKAFSRQETLTLQTQLRHAGFNPGPADGVFGSRTKLVLDRLRDGCPTINDYAALSEQSAPAIGKTNLTRQAAQRASVSIGSSPVFTSERGEPVNAVAVTSMGQSRDEVRILQLRLRDAGYDPGPFDGVMGPKTKLALQQLQASQKSGKTKASSTAGISTQY